MAHGNKLITRSETQCFSYRNRVGISKTVNAFPEVFYTNTDSILQEKSADILMPFNFFKS